MAFVPRLTAPEAGNKYYIRIDSGGYSRAILGQPTYVCNVLANCVGYAYGRFHEIAGRKEMDLFDPINGEDIFENAKNHGLQFGDKPALGAMICWGAGKLHTSADGAGHVAIVEQINADGSIGIWMGVREYILDNKTHERGWMLGRKIRWIHIPRLYLSAITSARYNTVTMPVPHLS